jgi:hypothetical protein
MDRFYSQVNKIVFCLDGKKFMLDCICFWYYEYFPFKINRPRTQLLLTNPTNVFEMRELIEFLRCFNCGFNSDDGRKGLSFYSLDVDLREDKGCFFLWGKN